MNKSHSFQLEPKGPTSFYTCSFVVGQLQPREDFRPVPSPVCRRGPLTATLSSAHRVQTEATVAKVMTFPPILCAVRL